MFFIFMFTYTTDVKHLLVWAQINITAVGGCTNAIVCLEKKWCVLWWGKGRGGVNICWSILWLIKVPFSRNLSDHMSITTFTSTILYSVHVCIYMCVYQLVGYAQSCYSHYGIHCMNGAKHPLVISVKKFCLIGLCV